MSYLKENSMAVLAKGEVRVEPRHGHRRTEMNIDREAMVEAMMADAGLLEGGTSVESVLAAIEKETKAVELREGRKLWEWGLEFLVDLSEGMKWKEALAKEGLVQMETNLMQRKSKTYRALFHVAEDLRMSSWMPQVLDSTLDLAVNGEVRKVFDKSGKCIGETTERSVKAQELLLRAGDKRFAEKVVPGGGVGNKTYNFAVFPNVQLPAPGTRMAGLGIGGEEIEGEAKVLPDGGEAALDFSADFGVGIDMAAKMAALPEVD